MKRIQELYRPVNRPIKIVQFGEGNFLRAFVDYMADVANETGVFNGNIAIVKPLASGNLDRFHTQNNLYTVSLRGKRAGKLYMENRVITSVAKAIDCYTEYNAFLELARLSSLEFVISNTTEAGIVYDPLDRFELTPPVTYPGKLTKFLYERFQTFSGDPEKGLVLLPVELIEDNGAKLQECVLSYARLWGLGGAFTGWVTEACRFCTTLVDRIVTGYPREEAAPIFSRLGYTDELLDLAEPFGLWVIESERDISARLPFDKAGQPVLFTKNLRPYRERKVYILNGAHTSVALAGYLAGKNTVLECMDDPLFHKYLETVVRQEIVPAVPLPPEETAAFADSVLERFENPFVKHTLLSISLNSVSKWKSRILPTFRRQYRTSGKPPELLTFSFAALMAFYTSGKLESQALIGSRDGEPYEIHDDGDVLHFFAENSSKPAEEFVQALASNTALWGRDLTEYTPFPEMVCRYLDDIRRNGMTKAVEHILAEQR